jgi:hypothetical protein
MILLLLCMLAAATMGFAAHQGGTCGVVAVRLWVEQCDARLLVGFAVATGAATLVCLPLAWALQRGEGLPGNVMPGPALVLGALLLGCGALINGACMVGSLWRLGNGEAHLLALPFGIVLGDGLGRALGWRTLPPPSRFAHADGAGLLVVAAGALALVLAFGWLNRRGQGTRRLARTMVAMGLAGGFLFVALPGWTWAEVVTGASHAIAAGNGPMAGAGFRAMLATLAGALASGWMTGQLHLKWRGWPAVMRSLAGGLLMMLGAGLIPGGNDALLLAAAPAGASSALLAFGLMNLAIYGLVVAQRLTPWARPARH